MNGHVELAHRVSWALVRGGIPSGVWILHTCDTPHCVRVDHLIAVPTRRGRHANGEREAA